MNNTHFNCEESCHGGTNNISTLMNPTLSIILSWYPDITNIQDISEIKIIDGLIVFIYNGITMTCLNEGTKDNFSGTKSARFREIEQYRRESFRILQGGKK